MRNLGKLYLLGFRINLERVVYPICNLVRCSSHLIENRHGILARSLINELLEVRIVLIENAGQVIGESVLPDLL